MITDWTNKRVTVIGLGRFGGGVGVTRWLARTGAKVLVTDNQSPEILTTSLEQISDLNVELRLGRHDEADFRDTDLVVVNPAVRDDSPFLQAARAANVPLTTEINLFVERCPARSIGVTGSVGKSTIAAMTEHVLKNTITDRRIWLGGNIGRCLLDDLDTIQAEDLVVLELSSFQLLRTPIVRWSPHIAVITNVTPNHLDWHGAFAAYLAAKLNIIRFQDHQKDAIVFENTPELAHHLSSTLNQHTQRWCYGLDGDELFSDHDGRRLRWKHVELNVPGEHNRRNAAAALTVAHLLGIAPEAAVRGMTTFTALPDRLQCVAVRDGVTYYNDSKSTTPESANTAMNAINPPLLIILGGYDKGSDLRALAEITAKRTKFAACIGQTGPHLAALIQAAGGHAELCGELTKAVESCRRQAQPGDSVLLSPACASWDQFPDYRVRGETFIELVTSSQNDGE